MELKPSIIARLMGLDEMPNQREVPTRGKVLSEKYFRKVAFIGVRERSRCHDRCSSLVKTPESSDEGENLNSNFLEPSNFKASIFKTWGGREDNQKTEDFSSRCSSRKSTLEEMKFKSCLNTSSLQISERWKMVKDFQHLRRRQSSSRSGFCWTLGEMLSMHDHIHGGITCPFLNKNPCEFVKMRIKDRTTSHSNRSQVSGQVSVVTEEVLMLSGSSKIDSHFVDVESNSTMPEEILVSDNMELPSKSSRNASVVHKEVKKNKKQHQQRIWDLSWAKTAAPDVSINFRSSTTYPTENTTKQDELIVIPEESLMSSDCCSDTESFKETSQHSPYSVLEPFQDSPSSSSHSDDISDMQFHPFTKLTASSPTSTEEKDNSDRVGKNRDFHYLSNVLTEAGFHSLNLIQCFGKWHSTECPINPLLFETVEKKKYAGEKSMRRSERKLLFDRINLRLYDIYHRYAGFLSSPKPVSTMMSSKFWYEVTEELIWKLLIDEQERRKNSTATVNENDDFELLDYAEYVDFIAGEIEDMLVDELAAEFLSW